MSRALRVVRHADLDRLARLHALCFPGEAWDAVALAHILAMPRASGRFVEDEGGHALGLVFDLLLAGEEVEILTLGVHPARRRQGIARTLLGELFARAAAAGAKRVLLEVAADNPAALRLYSDLGFRTIGQRPGYYRRAAGPPVDAWLLCRGLTE
jgi:ribosomal-protein-alanine N-acetyltransferase